MWRIKGDPVGTVTVAALLKACSGKGAVRLEGEAAFYAALCAGVPIATSGVRDGKIVMTTEYPVDVWIDGGKIKVYVKGSENKS